MFRFPTQIQSIISSYKILGFVPLDKTLHFIVGMIITIIMRKFKVRMLFIFLILAAVELFKEFNDYYVLNSTLAEQIIDALATFIYPIMIMIIIKLKARNDKDQSK